MRYFEKINYDQFKKDICDNKELYNSYDLPKRATKQSAGYDFFALDDIEIKKGQIKKIATGVKVKLNDGEFLALFVRSGMGTRNNIRMCNQVGIVDADYYGNDTNDGHIFVFLQNEGQTDFKIKKGQHFVQGIFQKYLTVDNEEEINEKRLGGFGSTSEKEERL